MENLRKKIDEIDDKMLELFLERMAIVKRVALEKQKLKVDILDSDRESEVLSRLTSKVDEKYLAGLYPKFIITIMEISKLYQELIIKESK